MNPVIQVIVHQDGSRYKCTCGDEDKAYARDIMGRAENHNLRAHNNQAKIMQVEEFIEEAVDVDLEFWPPSERG